MSESEEDKGTGLDLVEVFRGSIEGRTDEELAEICRQSPAMHFATCVTIIDRDNKPLPRPIPNILQLRMSEVYEVLRSLGTKKIWMICVKPRQVGCSTFAQHIVYHFAQSLEHGAEGIVISDIKDHSEELLKKLKLYGKVDVFPWGHRMTSATKSSVAWDHGASFDVDTAENPDAGIGGTRQAAHFSEVAKWPATTVKNAEKTMAAVLPSINGNPSVVIAESTPEGAQGWFYNTYQTAYTLEDMLRMIEDGTVPDECWVKVFCAWHEFEEHKRSRPLTEAEIRMLEETQTNRERAGIERYGWSWEQVAWRREKIETVCNGSESVFDCYYPEDEVSCWAASGSARFDMQKLVDMDNKARAARCESGYLTRQDNGSVIFSTTQDGSGEIKIWERPYEGLRYLVACDPATGESQTVGKDPDATSILVFRQGYFDTKLDRWFPAKLVARVVHGFMGDDDVAGGHIDRLSRWYGGAPVALEINQGLQVLRVLKDAGVPVLKRTVESAKTRSKEEQYGYKLTNKDQRHMMIEGLAAAIREQELEIPDRDWIREAMAFIVYPKTGKAAAAPGEHDDDVMCSAMAWDALPSASEYRRHRAQRVDPPDRGRHGWRQVNNIKRGW